MALLVADASVRSARRLDVLVHAEEVGRVVLVLEGDQPLVVLAIGVSHHLLSLFEEAREVEVHAAVGEPPHVGYALSDPGYVGLVLVWLFPVPFDAEQVGRAAVAEGGLLGPEPVHGATLVPDVDRGVI